MHFLFTLVLVLVSFIPSPSFSETTHDKVMDLFIVAEYHNTMITLYDMAQISAYSKLNALAKVCNDDSLLTKLETTYPDVFKFIDDTQSTALALTKKRLPEYDWSRFVQPIPSLSFVVLTSSAHAMEHAYLDRYILDKILDETLCTREIDSVAKSVFTNSYIH